tara:strand:- start:797 stop:2131 length:1335 start_codon:yes stop_codon:yes gene_type:complete
MKLYSAQNYVLKNLKSAGARDVVVLSSKGESNQLKFVNNDIVMNQNWDNNSLNVFVAVGNEKIRTASTDLNFSSKDKIDAQLKKLIKFVAKTKPNRDYVGIAKGDFRYKKISGIYDDKISNVEKEGVDCLVDAIDLALQHGAERVGGTLSYGFSNNRVLTSNGIDQDYDSTDISLSMRAFVNKASSHKVVSASNMKNFKYRPKIIEAAQEAKNSIGAEKIKAGDYEILFDPLAFSVIINQIGNSSVAENVEVGTSFFRDKLGAEVASKNFSLYDVGNLSGGLSSSPFDDEGRPTKATEIISSGTLKTYLTTTSSAERFGLKPTGNSGIISARPTNLVVPIGKTSRSKLLSSIDKGLIVTNTWYTRYQNEITGEFSTVPRDAIFVVNKGQIVGSAKNVRLSGNMIDLMKGISALSNSKERIVGWDSDIPSDVPTAKVDKLKVTVV